MSVPDSGSLTVTVAVAVLTLPFSSWARSVYVVVSVGETSLLPFGFTTPTPLSISTEEANSAAQVSVDFAPFVMVAGDALNDLISASDTVAGTTVTRIDFFATP